MRSRRCARAAATLLVVTARRAHVLGLETPGPVLIPLTAADTCDDNLVAGRRSRRQAAGPLRAAGEAAARAIVLAKLAQRLPALLVADAACVAADVRAQMITVDADSIQRFSAQIVETLEIVSEARIPLEDGASARFCVFRDAVGSSPVAIILGDPDFSQPVAVRVHSACLTGDVFGSRRCDCGAQLKLAIAQLSESGGGVVLYLEQEGRGLGLANKMRAYELQDGGLDTMDANMMLGFDDDERDYGVAARMLRMIGANRVLLLTNNPGKLEALSEGGVDVAARIPLHTRDQSGKPPLSRDQGGACRSLARRHAGGRRPRSRHDRVAVVVRIRGIGSASALLRKIRTLPDRATVCHSWWPPRQLRTPDKDHWVGWLREYTGPGYYGRKNPDRDARFIYNHLNSPPMPIWLAVVSTLSAADHLSAFCSA